jgi:hypothetical protein
VDYGTLPWLSSQSIFLKFSRDFFHPTAKESAGLLVGDMASDPLIVGKALK